MLRYSTRLCAVVVGGGLLAPTAPRRQFAGASGGDGAGDIFTGGKQHRGRHHSSNGGGDGGPAAAEEAVADTIDGFFGALRRRFAEYDLKKDRRLDDREAAEGRRRERASMGHGGHLGGGGGGGDVTDHGGGGGDVGPLSIAENPQACPRSVLFTPGANARAMRKILDLRADCFIIDLEDSVGPSMKRDARGLVRDFINDFTADKAIADRLESDPRAVARYHKRLVIRINSPDYDPSNAMLDLELIAELGTAVEGIAIPKVTKETYGLIGEYAHPDHQLWAFFETPQSILDARDICFQRKYTYAVMGYNDLANELHLPISATAGEGGGSSSGGGGGALLSQGRSEIERDLARHVSRLPLLHSAMQVILPARAAGMHVIDAVFNDPTDAEGFRRELLVCRSLGFNGKALIHPSQVGPTNAAYAPTEAEVEWARRISLAVANAKGGVATVDGKMVEDLHVRQARRMLALHRSTALEREEEEERRAERREATAAGGCGGTDGEGNSDDGDTDAGGGSAKAERRDDMVRKPPSRQGSVRQS